MICRAISTGMLAVGLASAPAFAQTAMDVMGGMAAQEHEQAAAGAAAAGTRSIVGAVFGAGQGIATGQGNTAPAAVAAAQAPAAEGGVHVEPVARTGPSGGTDVEGSPAVYEVPHVGTAAIDTHGRDQFRPFTLDLRPETRENEVLSPLQRYEIPQLRLAGVVLDLKPPRAMLQDNSGMGFIITPGTPIGRRHGVVKSIESKRVIVEERVLDYYGREQVHQVAIEMPKDDKPQSAGQE